MDILREVMDASTHAMFLTDAHGIVTHINTQAQERFGLAGQSSRSHKAGRLSTGDIVILADTAIGADDGELTPTDLAHLRIQERKLRSGDMVAAVGVYDDPNSDTVYKFIPGSDASVMTLRTVYHGLSISIEIGEREVSVTVDGAVYSIRYFLCIGQMVVLDGATHQVKFWEERGYTDKKEGIGHLLRGGRFSAKSPGCQVDIVGHSYHRFLEGALFRQHLDQVLDGSSPGHRDQLYDINGYTLVASILPIPAGKAPEGAIVKFRSVEDIRTTIQERNDAIRFAERSYRRAVSGAAQPAGFDTLPGGSSAMASVKRYAYKLSQLDCSVLLTGESDTGKSHLARSIQQAQPRKGPFLQVDCSTIAPTLFESEMFGYVGGAFTGADPRGRAGFFEEANGGTIFLDEIGELPLPVQAKLLNVIQNKTIFRVGSTKPIQVDVRILAATNRDLKAEVAAGHFRADLYYRLSAFSLELPPLRECQEDIFFLIESLMDGIRRKYDMPDKSLSGEVFSKLVAYDWPGNIRELENVLERAVALSDSDIIYPEHIHLEHEPQAATLRQMLYQEEDRILRQTLQQCGGSRVQAMERLGVTKTVFYAKLKEHHIS